MEECRGRADNSPATAPQQPKTPHPCPSRPANGGTENRRKGAGRRRHPLPETRRSGRRSPPPAPLRSVYDHQDNRRKRSASLTACHLEKSSQQGNPRRAASHMTPSGKTAGVPRLAEETHQGGTARADNTRSSRRKRRDSTPATEVMPPRQKEQKPPEKVGCSTDPQG